MLADLQFEIMEVARKAMPVRRAGRRTQVSSELKLAATFLEQPVVMGGGGQLQEQVRHHQMVLGVARFLQDGLSVLLGGLDG